MDFKGIWWIAKIYKKESIGSLFLLFLFPGPLVVNDRFLFSYYEIIINLSKEMISFPVASLVSSYWHDHIPKSGFLAQMIILNDVSWSRYFVPVMEYSILIINLLENHGVSLYCLFLQVTNETMTEFRVEQVGCEEGVHEYSLETDDESSFKNTWLSHVQEDYQVESFIISLFNQVMDPSVVSLHCPETSQMSAHPSNHARNTSHGL